MLGCSSLGPYSFLFLGSSSLTLAREFLGHFSPNGEGSIQVPYENAPLSSGASLRMRLHESVHLLSRFLGPRLALSVYVSPEGNVTL